MFPIGKLTGALLVITILLETVQLSVAVGADNDTVAVHPTPAEAVTATGVLSTGAILS